MFGDTNIESNDDVQNQINDPSDGKGKTKKRGCFQQGCLVIIIFLCLLIFSPFLSTLFGPSKEEWQELTKSREEILPKYAALILQYEEDNGVYPDSLEDLIPKYTTKLPDEMNKLVNPDFSYDVINCDFAPGCTPLFIYSYCGAPIDCLVRYSVKDNEFSYQE